MSIIGAKVQCSPAEVASSAATRAARSSLSGAQVAASANGTGKIVR